MTAKSDTISTLETKYRDFRAGIADLPEKAYGETWLGEWNLSQVLAHMSGWFREMTAGIERVCRGERPTPQGVDYTDENAWNGRFASRAEAGGDALREFDAAFAAYVGAATALPEDSFGIDPEKGKPKIGSRLLQGAGIGHFEEHQPGLDEWLAGRR